MGCTTSEYRRLQFQVRKAREAKKKKGEQDLAKLNEELVKQLETVTSQLQVVTHKYRVLQQKLNKCECASSRKSRKRKISHLQVETGAIFRIKD